MVRRSDGERLTEEQERCVVEVQLVALEVVPLSLGLLMMVELGRGVCWLGAAEQASVHQPTIRRLAHSSLPHLHHCCTVEEDERRQLHCSYAEAKLEVVDPAHEHCD